MADYEFTMSSGADQHIKQATEEFLNMIGGEILSDMQRAVPVDSGDLKDSLIAEVSNQELRVGSKDVDYSVDVEMGTSRSPAQPYMRPSLFRRRTP